MCELCYDEEPKESVTLFNRKFSVTTMKCDNAIAKCFENEKFVIICFGGTNDMKDVQSDFNIFYTSFKGISGVHKGFYKEYSKLKVSIDSILSLTSKQIILSGHSLGGSIAYLAACDWCHRVTCLVTFGMPKTATRNFVYHEDFKRMVVIRWVNGKDRVVRLPSTRYIHCGCERLLDDRRSWLHKVFKPRAYHKIKQYRKSLFLYPDLICQPYENILDSTQLP